jgi:hypothetical protein
VAGATNAWEVSIAHLSDLSVRRPPASAANAR